MSIYKHGKTPSSRKAHERLRRHSSQPPHYRSDDPAPTSPIINIDTTPDYSPSPPSDPGYSGGGGGDTGGGGANGDF